MLDYVLRISNESAKAMGQIFDASLFFDAIACVDIERNLKKEARQQVKQPNKDTKEHESDEKEKENATNSKKNVKSQQITPSRVPVTRGEPGSTSK